MNQTYEYGMTDSEVDSSIANQSAKFLYTEIVFENIEWINPQCEDPTLLPSTSTVEFNLDVEFFKASLEQVKKSFTETSSSDLLKTIAINLLCEHYDQPTDSIDFDINVCDIWYENESSEVYVG